LFIDLLLYVPELLEFSPGVFNLICQELLFLCQKFRIPRVELEQALNFAKFAS